MRFRGMIVVLSVVAWGCGGDDSGSPIKTSTDGSVDGSTPPGDSGIRVVPDARAPDGGPIYVGPDGGFVDLGPDGAVVPPDASSDAGQDAAPVACTAAFELVSATGAAPLFEAVRCTNVTSPQYDWGDGAGFAAANTHRYSTVGTYTVTQKGISASGVQTTETATVTVTAAFAQVRFSATDKTALDDPNRIALISLSDDGLTLAQGNGLHDIYPAAARSDGSISPGSGVFYFEGHRLTDLPWYRGALGIATQALSQANGLPAIYAFDLSRPNTGAAIYNMGDGTVASGGGTCTGGPLDAGQVDTGYIVDYSGASPILHVLQLVGGVPAVGATCTLPVTAPVFIYFSGERARVGDELVLNTGGDTTNIPFHYSADQVRAALTAAGKAAAAAALVPGFGKTNPARQDSPVSLTITPADPTVALNTAVTLTGVASDLEDGDLSSQISWVDTSLNYKDQVVTKGASFSFTPTKLGLHPVLVKVKDLDGVTTTRTVNVKVTGALPTFNPVALIANQATKDARIDVSDNGLSARFYSYQKDGVRANQGMIGGYQYFEVHRNNPTRNLGMGLVVEDGQLLDYDFDPVPWSFSINVANSGTMYINLIFQAGTGSWQVNGADYADYGFAVDYRGPTPIVHVIINNKVQATLNLTQTFAPVFPMLYGNGPPDTNGQPTVLTNYDYDVNFGAGGPTSFRLDPVAALTAAGLPTTDFKKGWGPNAQ